MSGQAVLRTLEEQVDPRHAALLVVDMQNDFCAPGFAADRAGRDLGPFVAIRPRIVELASAARRAGTLVCHIGFATVADGASDDGPWAVQRGRSTFSGPAMAVAGTPGADFIAALRPEEGDTVVMKQRYSGFKYTNLEIMLRARGVRSLFLAGGSTNVCVESTLRDGFELGFYVSLVADACASWDMALHEATLRTVDHRFGRITTSSELAALWDAAVRTCRPPTGRAAPA